MHVAYPASPYVCCSALLQKFGDFLQFASAGADVVEEVAQLARVGLDLDIILLEFGIAFQHQNLVLWATGLACGVHGHHGETHGEDVGSRGRERRGRGGLGRG